MDWNKAYKIYNKIQEYEYELGVLTELAEQIADDRRSIEVDISHTNATVDNDYPVPMFAFAQPEQNSKKGLDIESFYLELKDELALEFIGNTIRVLTEHLKRFKQELKEIENNV